MEHALQIDHSGFVRRRGTGIAVYQKERKVTPIRIKHKNNERPGFALALIILFLFSAAITGTVAVLTGCRIESKQAAAKRGFKALLARRNFDIIRGIEKGSKLPEEAESERWKSRPDIREDRISREIIRRFPDSAKQRHCEETVSVVFLHGALEKNTSIPRPLEQQFSEKFRENISALAVGLLLDNRPNGKEPLALVKTAANPVAPAAVRWLMIPSLRNLLRAVKNTPKAERFFPVFLFSETCTGIGMEEARRTWEKIRAVESSNTGQDSLGMFPENHLSALLTTREPF